MTKNDARKKYREIRSMLTDDLLSAASSSICKQLISLDFKTNTIHVFLPIKRLKEVDLWEFIHYSHANSITVCTSVSNFDDSSMKTIILTSETDLEENSWGIPEPKSGKEISPLDIDVVIVPLLYADAEGNRVGYGKGFYDRFLATCKPDVHKIGVNYFAPKETIENTDETDVKLDQLIFCK